MSLLTNELFLYYVRRNMWSDVRRTMHYGASIDYQDHNGFTALMIAVENNYYGLAKQLINQGANKSLRNRRNNRALDLVNQSRYYSQFIALLEEN